MKTPCNFNLATFIRVKYISLRKSPRHTSTTHNRAGILGQEVSDDRKEPDRVTK